MGSWFPVVDRYLVRYVLVHVGAVWLGLVLFYVALGVVGELSVLRGDYTLIDCLLYSLMKAPGNAYRVFPFAALIGTLLGLGALAASRQLTVLRGAGCSKGRLMRPALLAIVLALVPAMGAGEWSGSQLEVRAHSFRVSEITGNVALAGVSGLWLRDGGSVVQIRRPWMPSRQNLEFDDVRVFAVRDGRLCRWAAAAQARHERDAWRLDDVTDIRLCGEQGTRIERTDSLAWPTNLSRELLTNTPLRPSILGVRELRAYIAYLAANDLDAYHYRTALAQRFFYPLTVLSLVMLPLPLMLGPPRLLSRTVRLVIGIALGVAMYVVYELTEAVSAIYRFHPAIAGLVPFVVALGGAAWLYRKAP